MLQQPIDLSDANIEDPPRACTIDRRQNTQRREVGRSSAIIRIILSRLKEGDQAEVYTERVGLRHFTRPISACFVADHRRRSSQVLTGHWTQESDSGEGPTASHGVAPY